MKNPQNCVLVHGEKKIIPKGAGCKKDIRGLVFLIKRRKKEKPNN